jgi:hypothetical protein
MKVLIDIPDNKQGEAFLRRAKELSYVQRAEKVTPATFDILTEIKQIKTAHRLAEKVKSGKLKTRAARDLLNEL